MMLLRTELRAGNRPFVVGDLLSMEARKKMADFSATQLQLGSNHANFLKTSEDQTTQGARVYNIVDLVESSWEWKTNCL